MGMGGAPLPPWAPQPEHWDARGLTPPLAAPFGGWDWRMRRLIALVWAPESEGGACPKLLDGLVSDMGADIGLICVRMSEKGVRIGRIYARVSEIDARIGLIWPRMTGKGAGIGHICPRMTGKGARVGLIRPRVN
jgi:hypothetical protein